MRRVAMVLLLLPLALGGCAAAGPAVTALATAGVAGSVGAATGSTVAGVAAGFAVSYGVDQGVKWAERRVEEKVQVAIAAAAAPLAPGQSAQWQVAGEGLFKDVPLEGHSGTVEVARAFGQAIPCKDVVFSLANDKKHAVYTGTVCRNDQGIWAWALSEPSVNRWGYLQ